MVDAELVERVKNAKGPDRALDNQIALAVDLYKGGPIYPSPRYTSSYDAAMTLIPSRSVPNVTPAEGGAVDVEVAGRMTRRADGNLVLALCEAGLAVRSSARQ